MKTSSFQPLTARFCNVAGPIDDVTQAWQPDRRDGSVYVCDDDLFLATQVALATSRPLLLQGEPGCGKSSYAAFVARNLEYRYYEAVITADTTARDLLWNFDMVRRLADAQTNRGGAALRDIEYIEPGPLWWLFDRSSAQMRGWLDEMSDGPPPRVAQEPFGKVNDKRKATKGVLLIDEIDKADPDLPNALLVPLGSLQFEVTDLRTRSLLVRHQPADDEAGSPSPSQVLIIVTTNGERALPAAFLRRCVVHRLSFPNTTAKLAEIAKVHFGAAVSAPAGDELARALAEKVLALRDKATSDSVHKPGIAEYLDALRACLSLGIQPDEADPNWACLSSATLSKAVE
jgi:MoxR-like ATPase